jgi:hypothetical protein
VPLAVQVAGHASKRGLIPRAPSADKLVTDIEGWLTAEYSDVLRSSRRTEPPAGGIELHLDLHPAALEAVITATDAGAVTLAAETSPVGPGYHTFVSRLAQRLGIDQSIEWSAAPASAGGAASDGPAPSPFADRSTIERSHLAWLGAHLVGIRDARRGLPRGIQLGIPSDTRYTFDGALATILGPRDDAWLEKAVVEPRSAVAILPWWADATDARYLLNRALCLMWTAVRWRPPIDPAERALLDEVVRLLARAFPLDPSLPYPWREWSELFELRNVDEPTAADIRERSRAIADDLPPIGYRRRPVTITHEGWSLEIPGSFAERRSPEEWWGGEAGRSITLAAVETGSMSGEAFLDQVASDLGFDAITHQAGAVVGRAKLGSDASSGVEVGVVEGYSAIRGSGAAIRIVFDDATDWQWALDMWRALSPAS